MALVLCDGAPGSLRAVEIASMPGLVLSRHDGEQLVLVHVWDAEAGDADGKFRQFIEAERKVARSADEQSVQKPQKSRQSSSANSNRSATHLAGDAVDPAVRASSDGGPKPKDANPAAHEGAGVGKGQRESASADDREMQCEGPRADEDSLEESAKVPLHEVVVRTLEVLQSNKHVRGTINYKVETSKFASGAFREYQQQEQRVRLLQQVYHHLATYSPPAAEAGAATNGGGAQAAAGGSGSPALNISSPHGATVGGGYVGVAPAGAAGALRLSSTHSKNPTTLIGARGQRSACATINGPGTQQRFEAVLKSLVEGDGVPSTQSTPWQHAPLPVEHDVGTQPQLSAREECATYIVSYAFSRAAHHSCRAILLGVGNRAAKKKSGGGAGGGEAEPEKGSGITPAPQGDGAGIRVGSVACAAYNLALRRAVPLWFIKASGTPVRRPTVSLRYVVLILVRPLTASSDAERILEISKALSSLTYTTGLLRSGTEDNVRVLLVVDAASDDSHGTMTPEAASAASTSPACGEEKTQPRAYEKLCQEYLDQHVDPSHRRAFQSMERNDVQPGSGAAVATSVTEATPSDAADAVAAAPPPPLAGSSSIVTLTITPSKGAPRPTVNDLPKQLIRFVTKMKADFLVLPSPGLAPNAIGSRTCAALLGLAKPHVIVAPPPCSREQTVHR